jgi:hypothetical protein
VQTFYGETGFSSQTHAVQDFPSGWDAAAKTILGGKDGMEVDRERLGGGGQKEKEKEKDDVHVLVGGGCHTTRLV